MHYEKLKRHVTNVHKDENKIAQVSHMSKNEQKNVFKELRNKGILEDNKVECLKDNPVFLPVKNVQGTLCYVQTVVVFSVKSIFTDTKKFVKRMV